MRSVAVSFALLALAACSNQAPEGKPATATPSPSGSAADPGPPKPLRTYLQGAAKGRLRSFPNEGGRPNMTQKPLNEADVKAFLAQLDLDQLPNGPLVRCPSDKVIQFQDKDGKELGSISWCQGAARFDGPNGLMGGIKAAPPAP